jgi:hypothetical protein
MRRPRGLDPADERAWRISLGAGAVVALVVWGLLERLRRAVGAVERDVGELWTTGKQVAQQTQAGHLFVAVSERADELGRETALLGYTQAGTADHDSPGEPA